MTRLDFFAPGVPVSKGSKHAFYDKKTCRAWVVENNNAVQKAWASLVSTKAHEAMQGAMPSTLPVSIRVAFTFPRPGNHFGSGANAAKLLPSAPREKTTAPDIDKLARCILDALTGVVYKDDSQVVSLRAVKGFVGDHAPGATVCVLFGDAPVPQSTKTAQDELKLWMGDEEDNG